jgi:hypothetical protein
MLMALLAAYLLGGGGASGGVLTVPAVKQIQARVEASVADSSRAEAAAAELAALKAEIKSFDKTFGKSGKQLTKLFKDHDAGAAEMQEALDALNRDWADAQSEALEIRARLREQLTREEWQAVFGSEAP